MAKIAVLTVGHIHTPGFVKKLVGRKDVEVVGVWDSERGLAEKFAGELGVGVLESAEGVLADKAVEGVVITGATSQHDGLAAACARAGKHLFVEKPLATTGAEAVKIFNAVKESGVIFQTGHFMRSDPVNRFIRQEIDAGNFGTITRARHSNCHHGATGGWFDKDYRWFFQKDQAGGGGFYDMGCHSVDILVYFFGAVERATASIGAKSIKYAIDEYGEGMLQFKSGVTATFAGSWVDAGNAVTHQICGTEGHLVVMNGGVFYSSSRTKVEGADGKVALDASVFPEGLPHAFDLFLDVLTGVRGKEVLIPVEDALNVARAMEAMYMGDRIGGWVKV